MTDERLKGWDLISLSGALYELIGYENPVIEYALKKAYCITLERNALVFHFENNTIPQYKILNSAYNRQYMQKKVQMFEPYAVIAYRLDNGIQAQEGEVIYQ